MGMNPKISIVLPTYNGQDFIIQSIESVINQSFPDWELIIVDDCSTDNTLKIAQEYASRDNRIIVLHNETNKKLPGALNVGFNVARGEYFTWTSDDNIAKPDWLSVLGNYLDKNPGVDMVVGQMDFINSDGKIIESQTQNKDAYFLTYRNNVGAAFMYRRSIADIVGPYDVDTFGVEDYDYWCRIALAGTIEYIPNNIYLYRIHGNSLTTTYRPQILKKVVLLHEKYSDKLIKKFKLNYYQSVKARYLRMNRKWEPAFILFDLYKFLLKQGTNLLLFWNKKLRRKTYARFQIRK
jgi:glycosyltransferase involved in cell wall biosynthesis